MRIRKNSKISPLLLSNSSSLHSVTTHHRCKLNQDPWDMGMLPSPSDSSTPPSPHHKVDGDGNSLGNGSLEDHIGAFQSVASLKYSMDGEDNIYSDDEEEEEGEKETIYCSKTYGDDNWECGREAKEGHSMCEFHLSLPKNNTASHPVVKKSSKPAKIRPPHRAKRSKLESNPYEIYYYSGFGPRWGKRRGVEKFAKAEKSVNVEPETARAATTPPLSTKSRIGSETFMHSEDDDEEDDEDENNEWKRGRKPVKERSLMSLM